MWRSGTSREIAVYHVSGNLAKLVIWKHPRERRNYDLPFNLSYILTTLLFCMHISPIIKFINSPDYGQPFIPLTPRFPLPPPPSRFIWRQYFNRVCAIVILETTSEDGELGVVECVFRTMALLDKRWSTRTLTAAAEANYIHLPTFKTYHLNILLLTTMSNRGVGGWGTERRGLVVTFSIILERDMQSIRARARNCSVWKKTDLLSSLCRILSPQWTHPVISLNQQNRRNRTAL